MEPLALAFKNYEINPFTDRGNGELMIIHHCVKCGQISPNRIAGDDSEYQVLSTLENSFNLNTYTISKIKSWKINIITPENKEEALISLFGINYKNILNDKKDYLE